jgi:peptide/nickel transport system permease protein
MVGAARSTMNQAPELLLWPALALTLTVLLINAFCDGIRDLVDPRSSVEAPRRMVAGGIIQQAKEGGTAPLEIRDLGIEIATPGGVINPVRDVSLTLAPAEIVAVVGESGSGKSLLSLAAIGLLPEAAWVSKGFIRIKGRDIVGRPEAELAVLRGRDIAMVFQDASASLNPVYRAGTQVEETLRAHGTAGAEARRSRVLSLLRQVGIPDPARVSRRYPHELSGGMRQRVMIAAAIANDPAIIIADESTTALDVTVQAQVLDLLVSLKDELGVSILFVTHSLPVVSEIADRIVVLYAGEVVEEGPAEAVLAAPHHAYTRALLESAPREDGPPPSGIPGSVPAPGKIPTGCVFEPRCAFRVAACGEHPALVETGDGRRSRCIRWKELA